MKGLILTTVLVLVLFVAVPISAMDSEPIVIDHNLISFNQADGIQTLEFTVLVTNLSALTISDITLKLLPGKLDIAEDLLINVGTIPNGGYVEVSVNFQTPAIYTQEAIAYLPLQWICEFNNGTSEYVSIATDSFEISRGEL